MAEQEPKTGRVTRADMNESTAAVLDLASSVHEVSSVYRQIRNLLALILSALVVVLGFQVVNYRRQSKSSARGQRIEAAANQILRQSTPEQQEANQKILDGILHRFGISVDESVRAVINEQQRANNQPVLPPVSTTTTTTGPPNPRQAGSSTTGTTTRPSTSSPSTSTTRPPDPTTTTRCLVPALPVCITDITGDLP